jgi:hypothetical protein
MKLNTHLVLHGEDMSGKQLTHSASKWPTLDSRAEELNELPEHRDQYLLLKMDNLKPNGAHVREVEDLVLNAHGWLLVRHRVTKTAQI